MSDKGKLQDRLQAYIALYSNATNKSSGGDSVNGGNDDRTCNLSHISLQDEDSIRHFQSWLNEIQKTLPPSELILSNCNLSDYSIQMILKTCMYSNMNLRYIDLSFNHMYIEGTLMLIECMQRNKSIESVNIFANDIFHASHSLRKEYANQSGENKSLTEIESILQDVVAAFKESQYVRSICGCRILHPSLRFNLSHTSNIEMEFLIAELAKNMDLKHAMISVHNSVGHHEEHHLLEKLLVALEKNRTLMSLSLQDIYSFQYKIMQHIADASVNIQHSTLKTLQLHFANNTNNLNNNNNSKYNATSFSTTRSQLLDFFKWLLENLLVGTKLTTLQFDSIPVNPTISEGSNMAVVDDALWDAVCELVSQNKTIIHFAVYNTVFNLDQWSRLLLALEKNTSIKVLHIGGKQASASEQIVLESNSFRVLQEIVDKRQANLIMRIGASREMVFSSNHIASKMSDEWQVGDRIESLGSDDNWAAANIIAITDDNKYNLLFESGQVKTSVRGMMIRRGDSFARSVCVQLVEVQQCDISNTQATTTTTSSATTNTGFSKLTSPSYRVGDNVFVRFFGDPTWYASKVTLVKQAIRENGDQKSLLLDVILEDDGSTIQEVEEHMVSPFDFNSVEGVEVFYDNGIYQRGDYVEICINGGAVSTNSWRRGRVAFDKKNGSYDIRMENGSDELNVRGRYIRHHYRSMEAAEIRILHTDCWISGKVTSAERNGLYQVTYDNTAVGQCHPLLTSNNNPNIKFQNNSNNYTIAEEAAVYAKRLVPSNRYQNNIRLKAIEHYKSLHRYRILSASAANTGSANKFRGNTRESISLDDPNPLQANTTQGAVSSALKLVQSQASKEIDKPEEPNTSKSTHHNRHHHHHHNSNNKHGKHHQSKHQHNKHQKHQHHDDSDHDGEAEDGYHHEQHETPNRQQSNFQHEDEEDEDHIQRHIRKNSNDKVRRPSREKDRKERAQVPSDALENTFEGMRISPDHPQYSTYINSQPAQPLSKPDMIPNTTYEQAEILGDDSYPVRKVASAKKALPENRQPFQPKINAQSQKAKFKVGARIYFRPTSQSANNSNISLPGVVVRYLGDALYRIILDDEDHEMEVHEDIIDSAYKVVDYSFDRRAQQATNQSVSKSPYQNRDANNLDPNISASLWNEEEASREYEAASTPARAGRPPQNSPATINKIPNYTVNSNEESAFPMMPTHASKPVVQRTPLNFSQEPKSSLAAVPNSPVPEMKWIPEAAPEPRLQYQPVAAVAPNMSTGYLREGMRVEYKPSASSSFPGVVTYADPQQRFYTVLLEDGNVLDQVHGDYLFPIKKELMRSPKFFQTSVQQPAVEQNVPAVESYPPVNVVEAFGSPRKPIAPSSVASAMKSPFHSSARKLVHNKQEEVTLYPQQLENPDNVNLALFQASILQPSLDITQVAEEDIDQISPNFCVKIDKSVASHQKQGTLSVTLYSTKLPPALNKKQTLKSRRWLELVVSEEFSLECAWSCMFSFRTSGSTHYYFDMKTLIVKDSFLLPFFLTMHSMSSSSASNSHYAGGIKAILYEDHVMQAVVSSALFFPSPVTQQGQIMDEIWLLDALAEDAPSSSRALRSSGQSLYRALQQASIVKDNIPKHCKVNYIKLLPSSGYQLPLPDAQVGSSGYQLVVGMDDLLPTAYGQIQYPNFDALCQKNPYISQCIQRCAAYASNGFVLTIMIGQQGMSKSLLSFLKTVPPAVMLSFLPIDASSMTFIQASTNSINENIKWTELFNHFKTLNQRLEKDDTSIPSGFMLFPDRNVMSSLKDTRESLLQMTSALSRKKAGSWHVHFYPKWTTASSTSWSEVEAMLTRPKGSHSMLLNWEEVLAMVPMMKLNLVSALIHFHLLQQSGQSANSQQNLSQHIGSLALLYEFFDIMEDSYARYQQNALHAISANSTWMDIAHDIILEMLQKHELFTKTGSIAVVLQDYLKSSLVAMCERVLLHPKLYSEDDFDDRVVEVRTLLDDHGGFQQWMEACDVYLLQCHAKHRQEENMVWTKFVDGFTYQQCYRRWLDSFGMPLSNTNRVATISLQDIAQASTYQEANNKMMMNPGLMMSTTHSSVGATFATTASNVMASDDIMSTLLEKVGMSDVGQASITRDALVQIGCQSWGDFMELLSIFSATNGNQLAMTSAQFMESLRKFLQEEVKLTLLNAMKIVNYFILLRNSS